MKERSKNSSPSPYPLFFEVEQDDRVSTSGKVLEQLLKEALVAIRKNRTDDESEVFQLFIHSTMDQADGVTRSEVGVDRFDAKSKGKACIYGRLAGWHKT